MQKCEKWSVCVIVIVIVIVIVNLNCEMEQKKQISPLRVSLSFSCPSESLEVSKQPFLLLLYCPGWRPVIAHVSGITNHVR